MKFFLSSTYEDLKGFRQVAINTLEDLCCQVEAMEYFEASTMTNKEVCLQRLRESDLVIGIYGRRYGSIDPETDTSYTELEYDAAVDAGIPVLGFVLQVGKNEREEREWEFIHKIYDHGVLCGKIDKKRDFFLKLNSSLREYFDGLNGYDYSGIWSDIVEAEEKVSGAFDGKIPKEEDMDMALDELEDMENNFNLSRFRIIVAYLKLMRLKDRLLHEPWGEELRNEVMKGKENYLKVINREIK